LLDRRLFLQGAILQGAAIAPLATPAFGEAVPQSRTLLVTHAACKDHDTGAGHPERAARMTAIDLAVAHEDFSSLQRQAAPLRDDAEAAILRVHSQAHVDRIKAAVASVKEAPVHLDRDTLVSAGSWDAAMRGIGAGLLAVDSIMGETPKAANAFCQIRPPGHHAGREAAMGFCLFNTVAVTAAYARASYGLERIAIVDFDVHHGNGTQSIFWSDASTFYGSTHQMPLFPGTGAVSETGVGNIVNAPLVKGDGGPEFREAMRSRILPKLDAFRPDLILVSAGFDAHIHDPLAGLRLREDDFDWITQEILAAAHKHCGGRVVSILEGGYLLDALAASAAVHLRGLMRAA